MKIACISDLHLKLSGPRLEECERTMIWLRDDLIMQHPDLIIIVGDFYHQRATPQEERFAQEWIRKIVSDCGCDMWILRGNHDDGNQLDVLAATATSGGSVRSLHRPESWILPKFDIQISALPWPDLGYFAAAVSVDMSIAERREAAQAALVDVLRGFRPKIKIPHLLVAHANILGASCDSGQPVASGNEIALTVADLMEAEPGIVVLGHIHAAQSLVAPVPMFYCGSLFRTTFGESAGRKGYSIVEWTGTEWHIEERSGPARPMVLLEGKWIDGQLMGLEHGPLDDAEVRLRMEFPSEEREAARIQAEELKKVLEAEGAHSVTIDERPVIVTRSRCVEITAARTTIEKLKAWAQSAGSEVPEDVEAKLQILEAEITI